MKRAAKVLAGVKKLLTRRATMSALGHASVNLSYERNKLARRKSLVAKRFFASSDQAERAKLSAEDRKLGKLLADIRLYELKVDQATDAAAAREVRENPRRKNPDESLRALERAARTGDTAAAHRYIAALKRQDPARYREHLLSVLGRIYSAADFDFDAARAAEHGDNTDVLEDYVAESDRSGELYRINPAPRSKKCRDGRHDFEPATGLCRRAGCDAFHHAGQVTLFGRDLDPAAVREAKARVGRTGQGEMFVNPTLKGWKTRGVLVVEKKGRKVRLRGLRVNPDRLEFAEVQSEGRLGSDVKGGTANRFLQVIAQSFAGGRAFSAKELAAEAGASETAARSGIKALRARGYVHEFGRELNQKGKPGPLRFVGTLQAEERAQSQRDVEAEREGELLADREIMAREALAEFLSIPRAKPGQGATYRPLIRRKATPGHKLPRLTSKRIRGAGYRVCQNPLEPAEVVEATGTAEGLVQRAVRAKDIPSRRRLLARADQVVQDVVRFGTVGAVVKVRHRLARVVRAVASVRR